MVNTTGEPVFVLIMAGEAGSGFAISTVKNWLQDEQPSAIERLSGGNANLLDVERREGDCLPEVAAVLARDAEMLVPFLLNN